MITGKNRTHGFQQISGNFPLKNRPHRAGFDICRIQARQQPRNRFFHHCPRIKILRTIKTNGLGIGFDDIAFFSAEINISISAVCLSVQIKPQRITDCQRPTPFGQTGFNHFIDPSVGLISQTLQIFQKADFVKLRQFCQGSIRHNLVIIAAAVVKEKRFFRINRPRIGQSLIDNQRNLCFVKINRFKTAFFAILQNNQRHAL